MTRTGLLASAAAAVIGLLALGGLAISDVVAPLGAPTLDALGNILLKVGVKPTVHAANNAELAAYRYRGSVIRDGFATSGDGGRATYNWSSSSCVIKGGDGGSQIPATKGGCWIIDWGSVGNKAFPAAFGFVGNGAASAAADTAAVQAAIKTGKGVYFPMLGKTFTPNAPIMQSASGQRISCDDRNNAWTINPGQLPEGALGVFVSTAAEPGPIVEDCGIFFGQDDAIDFTYPPAFYMENVKRFIMLRDGCYVATVCIDMKNNAGGSRIEDFQMSAFTTGIDIDGAVDTVRIIDAHGFLFRLSSAQTAALNTRVTWIEVGKADDLKIRGGMLLTGRAFNFHSSTTFCTLNCVPTATIDGMDFDTSLSGITQSAGTVTVNSGYAALGQASAQFVHLSGYAHLLLNGLPISFSNGGSNTTSPQILVNGPGADLQVVNSPNINPQVDQPILTCQQGNVIFSNNRVEHNALTANLVTPMINSTPLGSNSCRLTAIGNTVLDASGGTGTFIFTTAQDYHTIVGNVAPGWNYKLAGGTKAYQAGNR